MHIEEIKILVDVWYKVGQQVWLKFFFLFVRAEVSRRNRLFFFISAVIIQRKSNLVAQNFSRFRFYLNLDATNTFNEENVCVRYIERSAFDRDVVLQLFDFTFSSIFFMMLLGWFRFRSAQLSSSFISQFIGFRDLQAVLDKRNAIDFFFRLIGIDCFFFKNFGCRSFPALLVCIDFYLLNRQDHLFS